ncbi:hypothetical protein Taro_018115 [Colocasia esculenta]|uniref:Replication protein A 70 kDa DNA-binding subunit B/D first OB fold domain-containing protein n=1 Tax=Colocasia esculenta TaxID=4460 RepID=A0A843UT29_COLES|nr:hypothetical protein [Colocasia esculenta]
MKKSLINKFNYQLKEGSSYIITNFGVGENIGSYKSTQHAFRINFLYSMSVRECHDMLMPTKSFDFIAFKDITSNRIDVTYMVVVIGELTLTEDLFQLTERKFLDEIRETHQDGDTESFPEELDNFLHKKFIFMIQILEFNL